MNKKLNDNSIIMWIDPGTNIMGFGVIKIIKNEMIREIRKNLCFIYVIL